MYGYFFSAFNNFASFSNLLSLALQCTERPNCTAIFGDNSTNLFLNSREVSDGPRVDYTFSASNTGKLSSFLSLSNNF